MNRKEQIVVVRGGGDIATGTIIKLHHCGYSVLVLECENPSAIRRHVAVSEAVYEGTTHVEDITCCLVHTISEAKEIWRQGKVPLMVDPQGEIISKIRPFAVVDAILAKKNLGTNKKMADITVGLGPGFTAGNDVDIVIETMRGHNLGRLIMEGRALPNTGVPGIIAGYGKERVIHAPETGTLKGLCKIGDFVEKGQCIAVLEKDGMNINVEASISGLLRGLIRDGYPVKKGLKIADIDPRKSEYKNCFTVSDKARCIAGGVLEAILWLEQRNLGQEPEKVVSSEL